MRNEVWILMLGAALLSAGCSSSTKNNAGQASALENKDDLTLIAEQSKSMIAENSMVRSNEQVMARNRQVFQVGDRIRVDVWMKDRITQLGGYPLETIVPENGDLFFPHLGNVYVIGDTAPELTELLKKKLDVILSESFVVVNLSRDKIAGTDTRTSVELGNHVLVMGFVAKPGLYPLQPGLRMRDVLGMAGDFTRFANKTVFLVRGDRDQPEVQRIHMDDVLKGTDMSGNILLAANDAIYVSPKKLWEVADFVTTLLLPIIAVRDAVWVYDRVVQD